MLLEEALSGVRGIMVQLLSVLVVLCAGEPWVGYACLAGLARSRLSNTRSKYRTQPGRRVNISTQMSLTLQSLTRRSLDIKELPGGSPIRALVCTLSGQARKASYLP